MKKITCPDCGGVKLRKIEHDNLGDYCYCDYCEQSFEVDIEHLYKKAVES